MENSNELISEIKASGKGIYKITVEYLCESTMKTKQASFNIPPVSSGKSALNIVNASLTKSGVDVDYVEVVDYLYTETAEKKHTLESVTKKVNVPKETKAVLSKEELQEIEA